MDNDQRMKKRNFYLLSGTLTLIAGLILVMMLSGQKDTWKYYWDSSHRDMVDMSTMFSWILVIWGGAELVYGFVLGSVNVQSEVQATEAQSEEVVEWFEGEIIEKEWDPNHHQVEWIIMRQKNGVVVRMWHYIADDKIYKIGDQGLARAKDRLITEFIPSEYVK